MHPLAQDRHGRPLLPLFGAWLRGAIELLALARSRWSLRSRTKRHA
ncbi:MAG: hypothetical protein ABI781_04710 [Burkholderiales bacterium]